MQFIFCEKQIENRTSRIPIKNPACGINYELPCYPAFLGRIQLKICFQPSFVLRLRTRKVPTIP